MTRGKENDVQALMRSGPTETRFEVSANGADAREICARMGAELIADADLEAGDLGHEGHAPLAEEVYSAGLWESAALDRAAA